MSLPTTDSEVDGVLRDLARLVSQGVNGCDEPASACSPRACRARWPPLPLEQAPHAYEIFQGKQDGCIKVVLKP